MSESHKTTISAEGFKTIAELKELLQDMSKEELATFKLLLEYMKSRQQTRNRQHKGC